MTKINDFSRDYMMSWTNPQKLDALNAKRIGYLNRGGELKELCKDEGTIRALLRSQRTTDRWVRRLNLAGISNKDVREITSMCPKLRRIVRKTDSPISK
jgi:hypothetical protein